jgi:hypothetical protein
VASAIAALFPYFSTGYYSSYGFYSYYGTILGGYLGLPSVLSFAGLIVGPYFGLAGLIAGDRSVWVEATRLIERHISFPFITGLALFYASLSGFGLLAVMMGYAVFVVLSTVIGLKATRAQKSSMQPQPTRPT